MGGALSPFQVVVLNKDDKWGRESMKKKEKGTFTRWLLVLYDTIIFLSIDAFLLIMYGGSDKPTLFGLIGHASLSFVVVIGMRFLFGCYREILRFGGVETYIRIMISDAIAFWVYYLLAKSLNIQQITFVKMLALVTMNLLGALCMRMVYRYAYKTSSSDTPLGRISGYLLRLFAHLEPKVSVEKRETKVAIFGAGVLGYTLFEDIYVNKEYPYEVRCFIDEDRKKIGRNIGNIKVIGWSEATPETLRRDYGVEEVFVAINEISNEKLRRIYERYSSDGIKCRKYDVLGNISRDSRARLKDIEIEELLFRKPIVMGTEKVKSYYNGKTILITGGGGSIGSELARQIASLNPKKLIVLDIYENNAYELEMEMKMRYKDDLDFSVEICSITNKSALRRVFEKYDIDIIINAAAHKHVPLMESNPVEAIENNIYGCKNLIELTEEYKVPRFMMVSTDKAVNPTNVMGATKRMCEMMVLSSAKKGGTVYSCTRFGNVLGSAGSVIPLFKKQIASGGPVTITDKRITRYFMTIPEASQLVLQSGALSNNGELFVLDMGQPVKILNLAENMIKLSGAKDVEIVETGLRPGEKLYEELLIKDEKIKKTENNLIFIEKDEPLDEEEINNKLKILDGVFRENITAEEVKKILREVVPTYKEPESVNSKVERI